MNVKLFEEQLKTLRELKCIDDETELMVMIGDGIHPWEICDVIETVAPAVIMKPDHIDKYAVKIGFRTVK